MESYRIPLALVIALFTMIALTMPTQAEPTSAEIEQLLDEASKALQQQDQHDSISKFSQIIQSPGASQSQRTSAYSGRCAARYKQSLSSRELKETRAAIDDCTQAIHLQSDHQRSYRLRGTAHLTANNPESALSDLNVSSALDPEDHLTLQNRGLAKAKLKQFDEAIADFNKAIQLKPNHPWSYYNRGRLHAAKNLHDQAIEDFSQFIRFKQDYSQVYMHRGRSQMLTEKYQQAVSDFYHALNLKPNNTSAQAYRGICLFLMKRFSDAEEDFRTVLAQWPQNLENRMWLYLDLEWQHKPGKEAFAGEAGLFNPQQWPGVMTAFLMDKISGEEALSVARQAKSPQKYREQESLILFLLGQKALLDRKPQEAEQWFKEIVNAQDQQPTLLHAAKHALKTLQNSPDTSLLATNQKPSQTINTQVQKADPTQTIQIQEVAPTQAIQVQKSAPTQAIQVQKSAPKKSLVKITPIPTKANITTIKRKTPPSRNSKGHFVFKVGAYLDTKYADQALSDTTKLRLPVYVEEATVNKNVYLRIWVGPFKERSKAEQAREKVITVPGMNPGPISQL